MTHDQNGETVHADIRKHRTKSGGTAWGRNVWWGSGYVTNVRRQYYRSRQEARDGDISQPGTVSPDMIDCAAPQIAGRGR